MPCDSVVTNLVELRTANRDLLARAVAAEFKAQLVGVDAPVFRVDGYTVIIRDGRAESRHPDLGRVVDRLKVAYSTQAVQVAATRYGWVLKKKAENKYQAIRRA